MAKKFFYKNFFFKKIFFCKGYFYKKKFFYQLFVRVNHDGYIFLHVHLILFWVVVIHPRYAGTTDHRDKNLNVIIKKYERSLTFRRAPNVALYNPRGKL